MPNGSFVVPVPGGGGGLDRPVERDLDVVDADETDALGAADPAGSSVAEALVTDPAEAESGAAAESTAMAELADSSLDWGDLLVTTAMATAMPKSIAPQTSKMAAAGIRRRFKPDAVAPHAPDTEPGC